MEQQFGKLVGSMIEELASVEQKLREFEDTDLALEYTECISSILERYRDRHYQRTGDLNHLIRHGTPRKGQEQIHRGLSLTMPMPGGETMWLLNGTQLQKVDGHFTMFIIYAKRLYNLAISRIARLPLLSWVLYFRVPAEFGVLMGLERSD